MKKNEVKVGKVYSAKVTGKMVPVRIDAVNPHGGWEATNLVTKKRIYIKSAQRLRGLAATWPGKAEAKPAAKVATPAKKPAKASKDATIPKKADTGEPRGPGAKMSGLDAAAKVLALGSALPMRCGALVKIMIDRGYWKTNGKTPAATIYAAITREIAAKGDVSRFRKVERGKFALATGKGK